MLINSNETFECGICFSLIMRPASCTKCRKMYCYDCLKMLKDQNNATCPMRCRPWDIKVISEEELSDYFKLQTVCACCQEEFMLRNMLEHITLASNPFVCFNHLRCKSSSKFKIEGNPTFFCSEDCYKFWYVAFHFKKEKSYEDLWKEFKNGSNSFESIYKDKVQQFQMIPKMSDFKLDPETCSSHIVINNNNECSISNGNRFYQTVYSPEPLQKRLYSINTSLDIHQNYVKIGVAKEKIKKDNYAFCDDENGVAFVTNGQIRISNKDGSSEITQPLKRGPNNCDIIIDGIERVIKVNTMGTLNIDDFAEVAVIPKEWDEFYFAIAIKGNENIRIL
jgi:hypothetical protein